MSYLTNHQVLASNDLHEMRALLSAMSNADEIDVIGGGGEIDADIKAVSFSGLNLIHVAYGDVQVQVQSQGNDEDTLLLCVLTHGAGIAHHKGQEYDISVDKGLMRDMKTPISAHQENFASFALPLSIGMLKEHVRTLSSNEANLVDLEFDAELDLTSPGGRHVRDTIHYVANALDGPLRNLDNPIALDGLRDLLLSNILTLLPNSYSEMLNQQPTSGAVPYYVKRARDYIYAHADTSITLENLTSYAGCGYRTLQVAFMDAFGLSPMAYVKSVRLNCVRNDILVADDGVTVSDIAMKWGFIYMGRFANMYMKQHGVLPSHTLRTRR